MYLFLLLDTTKKQLSTEKKEAYINKMERMHLNAKEKQREIDKKICQGFSLPCRTIASIDVCLCAA